VLISGGSTLSVALSGQTSPLAQETKIENESSLHVRFTSPDSVFTESARMIVTNNSIITIEGQGAVLGASLYVLQPFIVSDNSSVKLVGPKSALLQLSNETVVTRNSSFILERESYLALIYALKVSNGSILSASGSSDVSILSGTVQIFDWSTILLRNSSLTLDNGTITTDITSSMVLQSGSRTHREGTASPESF
jgi:hypothetical protein